MEAYKFLNSLPAIIGIAGFFAYIWIGQSKIGGELLKDIIKKLRADPNLDIKQYGQLTAAKIDRLVKSDQSFRTVVNEGDRRLLGLLAVLQYVLTALVLIVCALLIAVSIWLYAQPEPLSIIQHGPESVTKESEGLLVDLDPVRVEWKASGKEEPISVFLENVDSHKRSEKKLVDSNVRSVMFGGADLVAVSSDRNYHGKNRIRSVIEWSRGTSVSEPKDVIVGIDVELRLNGKGIFEDGSERQLQLLLATIDQSTANLPRDYAFSGNFVGMTPTGPLVVPLRSTNTDGEVTIPGLDRLIWDNRIGFVYLEPDDPRIVRSHVFR